MPEVLLTGYKWLCGACGAIILAPDIHVDGDDRDHYSVIYTNQTRGLFDIH